MKQTITLTMKSLLVTALLLAPLAALQAVESNVAAAPVPTGNATRWPAERVFQWMEGR
jgi:hypothetical protein